MAKILGPEGRSRSQNSYLLDRLESKVAVRYVLQFSRGDAMDWKTMLAYITGSVDQELLLRNEYLAAENAFFEIRSEGACG